jgi:hypothetical protein
MTFVKGQSGNPSGRPKGVGDRRTAIRKALEPYKDEVILQVIDKAREGDNDMIKLFFSYCFAKPKSEAVNLDVDTRGITSKEGIRDVVSDVLDAALKGELPDDQGKAIASLVKTVSDIDTRIEDSKRLDAIEEKLGINNG